MKAFAKKEGLNVESLTVERLKGELRQRFLRFRTWQLGQVVRIWAEFLHDLRGELTIAIAQGSGMPSERHIDYKAYDDIPNLIHMPMIYTSNPMDFYRNVAGMRDYLLGGKYFDFVISALLGCVGCAHWPDLNRGFDIEYIWEVSRAARGIACVEDFLSHGEQDPRGVEVKPLPESVTKVKTAKGEVKIASPSENATPSASLIDSARALS